MVLFCGTIRSFKSRKERKKIERQSKSDEFHTFTIYHLELSLPKKEERKIKPPYIRAKRKKNYIWAHNDLCIIWECECDVVCINQITNQLLSIEVISVLAFRFHLFIIKNILLYDINGNGIAWWGNVENVCTK